jgi:cytidyltransferase-like protein
MTERVAVYGGSFSPFGNNHLDVVRHVADSGEFDRIVVVPSISHALKARTFPYEHRVNMATIALAHPGMPVPAEVSMVELYMLQTQPGPIFTIQLLRHLRDCHPDNRDAQLRFVVGPDIIAELDRWKYVDDIRREFGFFQVPETGVHASAVREMIWMGRAAWTRYVPHDVARYIKMHGLYQEAPA